MKKTLFILTILILLTACESKKRNSNENKIVTEKTELKKQKTELTIKEKEEKIRKKINDQYLKELSECSQNVDAVTNFNDKTEFWRICETDKGNRVIQIDSHNDSSYYQEIYFEKNGELIYAEESIKYLPINHYVLQTWTCQFYADNGKLISLMSLGHGKTEDEEWNPEIIFEMYKNRIAELNKIENK